MMKLADRFRASGVALAQADVQPCASIPRLLELRAQPSDSLLHHKRAGLQNLQQITSSFRTVCSGYCPFKLNSMLLYLVLLMRSQESVYDPLTAATLIQYK
jgi:hypothetical protein